MVASRPRIRHAITTARPANKMTSMEEFCRRRGGGAAGDGVVCRLARATAALGSSTTHWLGGAHAHARPSPARCTSRSPRGCPPDCCR